MYLLIYFQAKDTTRAGKAGEKGRKISSTHWFTARNGRNGQGWDSVPGGCKSPQHRVTLCFFPRYISRELDGTGGNWMEVEQLRLEGIVLQVMALLAVTELLSTIVDFPIAANKDM